MDSIFQKFGIYDFMGIWGAGALSVTYFFLTICKDIFSLDVFSLPVYIIVILYTAGAYIVGVILHELGKILFDFLPYFNADNIKQRMNVKFQKRPNFIPFNIIKHEYLSAINDTLTAEEYKEVKFDKALSYLKYKDNINTRRIDTYHSIYALARSLCLCFLMHAIIIFLTSHFFEEIDISMEKFFFVLDIVLVALFYIRAYRYYHSWVKNIFIQYNFLIKETSEKTDNN